MRLVGGLVAVVLAGWLVFEVGRQVEVGAQAVPIDRAAPEIAGGPWINGQPLAPAALRGRVVLVEFWTYG